MYIPVMELAAQLSEIIPASRVHARWIDRITYTNDASYFRLVPQAVVQPKDIGETQSLFKFTQQHKIPMTFRAAETSLSGQAVTDGILVDISKHWAHYRVEGNGTLIRFQPGIVAGFVNNVRSCSASQLFRPQAGAGWETDQHLKAMREISECSSESRLLCIR